MIVGKGGDKIIDGENHEGKERGSCYSVTSIYIMSFTLAYPRPAADAVYYI